MKTPISAISQAIMQQQRPRSLMTPILFALTMRVHDDCPGLLNDLFKCGFCLSEDEAKLFKACAAFDRPNPFSSMEGQFGWIIGDNFDHNKITLTGHGTIHVMGLMLTKTRIIPTQSRTVNHQIPRHGRECLKTKPIDKIPIIKIRKLTNAKPMFYKIAHDIIVEDSREHLDMFWKISLAYGKEKRGWQGVMTAITKGKQTDKASFDFLPMVNLDPNSWECIYSVLMWGKNECKKYGIEPVFTFDQPIWWNARQIKNQVEDLSTVILNLGGFHTDMSFLGAIGHIMQCSGLKQILSLVYPENTVSHMLSGKAFYRAIRGYFLVDAALNILIIKNYLFKDEATASNFLTIFNETLEKKDETRAINDEKMLNICKMFKLEKMKLKDHPTGELWIQFMDLVDHIRTSLRAQRTGNFQLYMKSLQSRQPYFSAAGRNNYAKSLPIFLQDLIDIEHTNPEAHRRFMDGFFFVRRSERYWAALSPDLVIEQALMAALKNCRSGITHGRGTDEAQILTWLYSRPAFAQLKTELGQLFKHDSKFIIKELTESRIKEDTKDIENILEYFELNNPFKVESEHLVDISNGVSYSNSNAHKALDVGKDILNDMDGADVSLFKFKKANKIKQMGLKTMIGKEEVVIDPFLMIERALIITNNSDITKQKVFEHELSVSPPSIFDSDGQMRLADDKSNLTDYIAQKFQQEMSTEDNNVLNIENTVIDMGSVLRSRVRFQKGETYGNIIEKYVKIVMGYPNSTPVFDGYGDDSTSTKYVTHLKRSKKLIPSNNVELAPHLPFNCESKDTFFANKYNKQSFITMLSQELEKRGVAVLNAKGDADQLIAQTAIDNAINFTTQVIGEDTDIFQLLVCLLKPNSKGLYMITEKRNAKHPILDIKSIRDKLGNDCAKCLPVIHAISGCDTTSKLFGIGKSTVMRKSISISKEASPFLSKDATQEQIEEAGRKIICLIYDEKATHFNLDLIRLSKFEQSVIKSMKTVPIHKLPPTTSAARYHSFRVYYQVQVWLGNESLHKATDWGWKLVKGNLYPKKMDKLPAPEALMKIMKCGCTLHCESNKCTCKRHGLYCTELCNNCTSDNCKNVEETDLNIEI